MLLLPAKKNARETPVCFSRKTTNSSKANIFFRGNPVKNWRDVCPSSLTIKKARAPFGVNVMFHFHEKSVDGNCAVRSSRIPYFLARKLFYTTAFPSLSAVIAGRETSRSGGAGMPKDFYWGSIFLPKCRYPILWRNLFPSIALLSGEFLIPYLLPKAQQRYQMAAKTLRR